MEDHRIEFMFEQYGKIEWITIKEAPRYYKWGYVKFFNHESALQAIKGLADQIP